MAAVSLWADLAVDDPDLFLDHDIAGVAAPEQRKHECAADGWMAREGELGAGREDAHARGAAEIVRLEHEYGLRVAELARDRLHRLGLELVGVEHHRERVAG